jgi:subtilisin family serine protease
MHIVATNNSWGGGGFSQSLKSAIDRANNANILFIAAAGNSSSNNDAIASYPSNYSSSNVIAVASITSTGSLSSFSSYGATQVDLGAPGSGIFSCVPVVSGKIALSGYASYNGTSMATPHVTGAVALYAATHSTATASAIKTAILGNVIATPSLNGKCVSGGRLNIAGF